MVILHEDVTGGPPTGKTAKSWADAIEASKPGVLEGIPITADPSDQVFSMTPWDGFARPGKVALAPDMTILAQYVGADDGAGYAAIEAHFAGAQP
jgi:hypothetical protein